MHPPSDKHAQWGLRSYKDGTMLKLRVQANASRNRLEKDEQRGFRLKITTAPINGAANTHCIKYLSSFFDVPKSKIEITRGHHSKEKWLWFKSIAPSYLEKVFASKKHTKR